MACEREIRQRRRKGKNRIELRVHIRNKCFLCVRVCSLSESSDLMCGSECVCERVIMMFLVPIMDHGLTSVI